MSSNPFEKPLTTEAIEAIRRAAKGEGRGRRQARQHPDSLPQAIEGFVEHHSEKYFLARESDEYEHMLLDKMIEQTLEPYQHIPAVAKALEYGLTPMLDTDEGRAARLELGAVLLYFTDRPRKWFGVRFVIDGHVFQYGLITGAKSTAQGDVDWVVATENGLDEYSPAEFVVGPASRIARRKHLFTRLGQRLKANRTIVRCNELGGEHGIDLNAGGEAQWDLIATMVESDYTATVTRLLTGVVYELKRGRYPRSELALPPGYVKPKEGGAKDHRVAPTTDPAVRRMVKRFIELAASDASEADMVAELAGMGLRSRHPGHRDDDGQLSADKVQDPKRLMESWFKHLTVYLDGQFLYRHEVTIPGLEKVHGLTVHRLHRADGGNIEVTLNFGVPQGGWHTTEMIEAAIRRRLTNASGHLSSPKERMKPLASLVRFIEGDYEFALLSKDATSYELRRRPAPPIGPGTSVKFDDKQGELVGRFKALHLHKGLAALLRQIAAGVPTTFACPTGDNQVDDGEIERLEGLIEEAKTIAGNARLTAVMASADEKAQYMKIAEDKEAEAAEYGRKVAVMKNAMHTRPNQLLGAEDIAALIVVLEKLEGEASLAVLRRVRTLTQDLRILDVEATKPTAILRGTFSVRTPLGSIAIGPVSVPVRNRAVAGAPKSTTRRIGYAKRNADLAVAILLEGATADEQHTLWDTEEFTPRTFVRRMESVLRPLVGGDVASAIIDCPAVETRRAVLAPYLGHSLDHGMEPSLAAEFRRIYHPRGFMWSKGWCPGGMARERQVIAFIDAYADDPDLGLPLAEVRDAFDYDDTAIYRIVHEGKAPYGRKVASFAPWYSRLDRHMVDVGGKRRAHIRLRECRHCGKRSMRQPLRVPEVPGFLLCVNPKCRRSLLLDMPFPDVYFEPWDGPQNVGSRSADILQVPEGRDWMSTGGRAVVGAVKVPVVYPARTAPRG